MTKLRFIHTADLHLDTPFKGLSRMDKALADILRNATLKSFSRIVDRCISQKVDFLLVAGDVFDSESQSLAAQLFFARELKRLEREGIMAYIITGNHDPLQSWLRELEMPSNVHRFASLHPERVIFNRDGVPLADIYGSSFESASVEENIALRFNREPSAAPFAIALMHGTISAATAKHAYAPFSMDDIRTKNFDYWALGHVHKRQIIHEAHPAVVYPGNPQGRDFGEPGPRGCYLVEIETNSTPRITFLPTHQLRFEELSLDISETGSVNELIPAIDRGLDRVLEKDPQSRCIARITLTGNSVLHKLLQQPAELEDLIRFYNEEQAGSMAFRLIDRIMVETRPLLNLDTLMQGESFVSQVLRDFKGIEQNEDAQRKMIAALSDEFGNVQVKRELDELTPADRQEILTNAKWLLVNHLIQEKDDF